MCLNKGLYKLPEYRNTQASQHSPGLDLVISGLDLVKVRLDLVIVRLDLTKPYLYTQKVALNEHSC